MYAQSHTVAKATNPAAHTDKWNGIFSHTLVKHIKTYYAELYKLDEHQDMLRGGESATMSIGMISDNLM